MKKTFFLVLLSISLVAFAPINVLGAPTEVNPQDLGNVHM